MMVIGLGGNVGGEDAVRARFVEARRRLGELGTIVKSSRLYRTAPIGPEQPDFLNAAVGVDWNPPAAQIVPTLHAIEAALGRDRAREVRFGPRTLDLDVLTWGGQTVRLPDLVVPHPRLEERLFALTPLLDVDDNRDLADAGGALPYQRVEMVASSW
jgi:2-amino-4-hydroxy-6-hydroxymethyldihydropteridine diphosphokinase